MPKSTFSPAFTVMAQALINARAKAGFKQSDLAERLGRPQSFVSKLERGERRLDLIEFIVVARALNADAAALLCEVAEAVGDDTRL